MNEAQLAVLTDALSSVGAPVDGAELAEVVRIARAGGLRELLDEMERSTVAMIAARDRNMQSRAEGQNWVRVQNVQALDEQIQRNRALLARARGVEPEPYEPWILPGY